MADADLGHDYEEHNQNIVEPDQNVVVDQAAEDYNADGKLQTLNAVAADNVSHRWPGWPGDNVFRMLVPTQKVGSIIGRKGELIKKIVEETKSRIKILDGPPGTAERVVMVFAKEEPDASLPPAIDGLLRVHKRIAGGLEDDEFSAAPVIGAKVSTRLLVAATQAGSLIGRQGTTVKSIQEASNCLVRVLGVEELPIFALQDDRVIEIVGEPIAIHKAVELVAFHLRKFLVDRSVIPLFEKQMQLPSHPKETVAPHFPWGPGPGPQAIPPNVTNPGYGPGPQCMAPREHENYYAPDLPPHMDKPPHHGISAYGRETSMNVHMPPNPPPPQLPNMTQVTQHMQIPLLYADAVIGTSGANISYIRRASGATVTIQETRGVPGEMTVEINGTASQVHMAQQFIQNFMAEGSMAASQAGVQTDQGYNSYPGHASAYPSGPPNAAVQGGPPQGQGYGAAYGTGYGY